jgi:hypothetical protein
MIVNFGCDVNIMNNKNCTPLDYCEFYNFHKMSDWLLLIGAYNGF